MKYLQTVLLVLIVSGIGFDVIARLNRIEDRIQMIGARSVQEPINLMLREMAMNGQLISDAQAKAVSLEVWKRLWSAKQNVKVVSCRWDVRFESWIVEIGIIDPKTGENLGSGCGVTISERGELERVEACQGL